jgi:hypothetical protein
MIRKLVSGERNTGDETKKRGILRSTTSGWAHHDPLNPNMAALTLVLQ